MAKKIKGVLIEPNKGLRVVEINDDVEEYHKLLDCRTFDIQNIEINGKRYDVFIDDEGKFKDGNQPTIVLTYGGKFQDVILGKAFFTGVDLETGETISLTEDEINHLLKQPLPKIVLNKDILHRYSIVAYKVLIATY